MSELRIGLVAEGPTDYELVQAALKAVLPSPFILTLLQPEASHPRFGGGWGGVLKWCDDTSRRHSGSLDSDPSLTRFDLLIIHLDVDVARKQYADCGHGIAAMAVQKGWGSLPCNAPCPPVANTCGALQNVLQSWLGRVQLGAKTVLCLPAQSTGAWLIAALLPATDELCQGLECNPAAEDGLSQLKKGQRVKKSVPDYREHAPKLIKNWSAVKALCSQAQVFEDAIQKAI